MNSTGIDTLFRAFVTGGALFLVAAFGESVRAAEAGLESLPPWTASQLEGTGEEPMPFRAVPTFEGLAFEAPLYLVGVPEGTTAEERFVVAEQGGSLWSFVNRPDVAERELFLQLVEPRAKGARGQPPFRTLGVAFHKDYPKKPFVFVSYNMPGEVAPADRTNRISRFRVGEMDPPRAERESEIVLLEWASNGHNGGDMKFGVDGMLYISTGDGASPGDPENVGQTTDNLLGSILRIDVGEKAGRKGYRVPKDNPFVGVEGILPEVWSYGLRNPWRMNFRPGTNDLWIGDNGDEHWEMVHLTAKGANHGWSAFEGSHPFRLTNALAGPTLVHTPPVVEHSHTEMRSVIGGLFYEGKKFKALRGHYLYGCYFTQRLWGFPVEGQAPGEARRLAQVGGPIVSFAQDRAGEPVILAFDGGFYRLEEADPDRELRPFPGLLSETGLFESTAKHRVEAGLIPYEVNAPGWRDGATGRRYFAVGPGELGDERVQVQMVPPGLMKIPKERFRNATGLDRWRFPTGSAFLQTFEIEGRRIETQVMFKDRGEWRFLTYAWNEAQDDAVLVVEEGENREIALPKGGTQSWRFMGRGECTACHTQRSMFVLGATMAQMNREFDYTELGGKKGNQLATFAKLGIFNNKFPKDSASWPVFADPADESADLDARARTYLHVNCAPCHRETGLGGRADFQLLYWLSLEDTNAVGQKPLVGLPGVEGAEVLAPGDPDRSEICRRMETRVVGKMPLVGSEQVDAEGLELVRRWIEGMAK